MGVWSLTSKIIALVGLEFGEGLVSVPTMVALNVLSCRGEEQCPLDSRRAEDPRHWRGSGHPFITAAKPPLKESPPGLVIPQRSCLFKVLQWKRNVHFCFRKDMQTREKTGLRAFCSILFPSLGDN